MAEISILYDGWDLVYRPNHPGALHLLAMLAQRPAQVRAWVALPGQSFHALDAGILLQVMRVPDSPAGRLRWEQRILPGLRRALDADLLHLSSGGPPLFGPPCSVVSPTWANERAYAAGEPSRSLAGRLREALAQGGAARVQRIFWPADLPPLASSASVVLLPPVLPSMFNAGSAAREASEGLGNILPGLDVDQPYILYHGPASPVALNRLFHAWSWAAEVIGADHPLVMVGLDAPTQARVMEILVDSPLLDTVHLIPPLSTANLAAVYQQASVLFHPTEAAPWGSPVRLALACGKPVVGLESGRMDALVGPAGYLIPPDASGQADARLLGAALLTVTVEEEMAQALSRAAVRRAQDWNIGEFSARLLAEYQSILF